jgi:hypothetical protein
VLGGHHLHPRLAALLVAVDGVVAALREELSPAGVEPDHQLRDEGVDRGAAAARLDRHAAGGNTEGVVETVGLLLARAAQGLQRPREAPERVEIVAVRPVDASRCDRLLAHAGVQVGEAQVVGDRQPLEARFGRPHREAVGLEREVERCGRHAASRGERRALHRRPGKHRDLAAGEVHRGQALARDRLEGVGAAEEQCRGRDVHADDQPPSGLAAHGEGVVDLGGLLVVDGERGDAGLREARGLLEGTEGFEAEPAREMLEGEAPQEIVPRGRPGRQRRRGVSAAPVPRRAPPGRVRATRGSSCRA